MSGNLYQPYFDVPLRVGDTVRLNAPYDTYGVIFKCQGKASNGKWCPLVRGLGKAKQPYVHTATWSN